jgi:hypothetical protein
MGTVPMMRALLAQPRATVQVDCRTGRETGPAYGVERQRTNRFLPRFIMTDLSEAGTQRCGASQLVPG